MVGGMVISAYLCTGKRNKRVTIKKVKIMEMNVMYNTICLAMMLLAGTVFTVWYTRHEHIEP